MGREIRKVPPNWQHPENDRGSPQPMYDRHIDDEMTDWLAELDAARSGNLDDVVKYYGGSLAAWLQDNLPPDPLVHRPWHDEEATWVQLWENVSEGTPVTPPFATKDELIEHLVAKGTDWDKGRPWSRKAAEDVVNSGYAPSLIVKSDEHGTHIYEPRDGMPP